jgi:hypothetical protein
MDFDSRVKRRTRRGRGGRYRLQVPSRLILCLALAGMAIAVHHGFPVLAHPLSLLTVTGCASLGLLARRGAAPRWLRIPTGGSRASRRETALLGRLATLCRAPHAPDRQARVASLVAVLAREAGFAPEPAAMLATASTPHRIGLMAADATKGDPGGDFGGIPSAQRAASIAGRLLDGESWLLASAAAMARTHQERWDGEGHPLGLSRLQIPFAGRLLQVALTLDAMIGDQPLTPHRLALLLDRIARQAGHALDPALATLAARSLPAFWSVVAQQPFPRTGPQRSSQPARSLRRAPVAAPVPAVLAALASRLATIGLTGA